MLPECRALSVLYYGEYSGMDEAWLTLGREVKARGLKPIGPPRVLGIVKGRVGEVHILLVHFLSSKAESFSESLEVDNLPGSQELNNIVHIRVIGKPQDIVVGYPSFLFCCNLIRTTFH